jgi:hypothetical protein
MRRLTLILAAALVAATIAGLGAGSAQASGHVCKLEKGQVAHVFAGGPMTRTACLMFNRGFHGHLFTGGFAGKARCTFYNARLNVAMGVMTRGALYGRMYCHLLTPSARKAGFRRMT